MSAVQESLFSTARWKADRRGADWFGDEFRDAESRIRAVGRRPEHGNRETAVARNRRALAFPTLIHGSANGVNYGNNRVS